MSIFRSVKPWLPCFLALSISFISLACDSGEMTNGDLQIQGYEGVQVQEFDTVDLAEDDPQCLVLLGFAASGLEEPDDWAGSHMLFDHITLADAEENEQDYFAGEEKASLAIGGETAAMAVIRTKAGESVNRLGMTENQAGEISLSLVIERENNHWDVMFPGGWHFALNETETPWTKGETYGYLIDMPLSAWAGEIAESDWLDSGSAQLALKIYRDGNRNGLLDADEAVEGNQAGEILPTDYAIIPDGCEGILIHQPSYEACSGDHEAARCAYAGGRNAAMPFYWFFRLQNYDGKVGDYYSDAEMARRKQCLEDYLLERAIGEIYAGGDEEVAVRGTYSSVRPLLDMPAIEHVELECTETSPVWDCAERNVDTCGDNPFCETLEASKVDIAGACIHTREPVACTRLTGCTADTQLLLSPEGACHLFYSGCRPDDAPWTSPPENSDCQWSSFPGEPLCEE